MKTTASITAMMLALAVMATGCNKKDDNPNMGPAQEAGAAVDNATANAAQETREAAQNVENATENAAERVDAATDRAGERIENAAERAEKNLEQAGAEVKQETREASAEVRQGADAMADKTGAALERAGEKMQDKK